MFCHPERSEGSLSMGSEMLRGVYPERSEGLSMTGPALVLKTHHYDWTGAGCVIDEMGN